MKQFPRARFTRSARAYVEPLESRKLLSTSVSMFHNDIASDGVNSTETQLTPVNVKPGSFGKIYTTPVDGAVYAQPLIEPQQTISAGPNTQAGATGIHDLAIVATENDSLYAIDGGDTVSGGSVLWQRSFLNLTVGQVGTTPGTDINDVLGATSITTVPDSAVDIDDISPVMGITGTPVVDTSKGIIYVVTFTTEIVGGATYYVQMLHAINISNGTDVVAPYLLGSTTNGNTNNTQIWVYGDGDGSVTDPYYNTGNPVDQFNALRENQRSALSLVNGTLYVEWASHGDNGPYHGWLCTWNVGNILTTGFDLSGVLCTSPNGGESGIWMGGGAMSFEPNGSAFYFETGNGPADGGGTQLNASGFPVTGDYPDALIKAEPDPTTSVTNQSIDGWGIKIVDYFIPYNQAQLDDADEDFGSGQPLLLPASAGIPGYPDLILAAGKEGTIYLLDADNLGHYNPNGDAALNSVPNGSGQDTPPVLIDGALSAPAYFDGEIYWNTGYDGPALQFSINSNGTLSQTGATPETDLGYIPGSVVVSSNGTSNGILWVTDRNTNELHAYETGNLSDELWNSGDNAAYATGDITKFAAPTVANGQVYLGTSDALIVYGLTPPETSPPVAPVLSGTGLSSSSVSLTWTDSSVRPNLSSGYLIEELVNGVYQQVTTAPAGATSIDVGGLTAQTTYSFVVQGFNGFGDSADSNVAIITTTNSAGTLNLSAGFTNSMGLLTYNGSATINGTDAELTNGTGYQAGSVFSDSAFDPAQFNTSFEFQTTAGTNTADGLTFTIQGNSPTALGGYGGALGYGAAGSSAGIANSVAIKFDLYSNAGEGPDSTGIYEDGATPTVPSTDLSSTAINLHSGDIFDVTMAYSGTSLVVTITDTQTNASATQTYAINIPYYVGSAAYVGFTAGDGGLTSTMNILNWTFTPPAAQAPAAPSGLGATPASATSVTLTWTNNSDNETGFQLDRALDSGFTTDLITQTLPATPDSFTDTYTGLSPGTTYYYRIRAINSAGTSANSATASASIPLAPAKPTDAVVTNVTTSEIDLQWMDNAGKTATGYNVLRAVNQGAFTLYATLPALNGADQEGGPQSPIYTWSDTNVQPGTFYEYHIEAYNISGYNDFAGTGTTTLTLAPILTATAGNNSVSLSWSAPTGAVAYNLYRGTSSGAETLLASDITAASYVDSTVVNGTPYYYYVTGLNNNISPVPAESAPSNVVNALPAAQVVPALNFASGFAGSTSSLKYNGSATISGSDAQLTNSGDYEADSVFSSSAVSVAQFNTSFEFQTTAGTNTADGFTFTLQGAGPTAVGGYGGALGYGAAGSASGIGDSVAIKFDLYSNAGEGPDSTGIYENGATPTIPSTDLTSTGINLHSGDVFNVAMAYNGTNLVVTIADTTTNATATQTYAVNIPSYTGSSAYVGFTAGTGGLTSTMNILNWTFTPGAVAAPAAPSALAGAAASASSVTLNWTNNATSETGFYLDRATNSTFTTNLVTQTLPATPDSFTDSLSGLAAGGTYYYRIRAYNSGGSSANSATATVTIPSVPAAPVLTASALSTTSMSLTWTDPSTAAQAATGYLIQELESGSYQQIATAATGATSATVGSLSPGTSYSFRIVGYNVSGDSAYSNVASASTIGSAPALNFASGFAGSNSSLKYNGSATISGTNAELTNGGGYEAGSVFSTTAVSVAQFTTSFEFQTSAGTNTADGLTFTLQGVGPTAVGGLGSGMGYGTDGASNSPLIGQSVAIKFGLYSSVGAGPDSTGIYENGEAPALPSTDMTSTGINLHSGDIFAVTMSYNGTNLVVTITDTTTNATATQTYAVNIPSYTGSSAYVGFTAGTGGLTSTMNILNWTFTPGTVPTPAAPSGLGAAAATATSVALTWSNNATNQTGFYLDRATNSAFTANLVTQTLPATPDTFTDSLTGLAAGGTYYYRIRAFNTGGSSSNSATTAVTIPLAPAAPALTASGASGSINLTWTDPSATTQTATGYVIQELVGTAYQQVATAAAGATSATIGSLSPGISYSFRIYGYNTSGNSAYSNVATASTTGTAPALNFGSGFAGSTSQLQYNGSATLSGSNAQLVNGGAYQAGSVFSSTAVNVAQFTTSFEFQTTAGTNTADGLTFTLQGVGPTALGGIGSGMGYGTDGASNSPLIGQSVAIKFGLYSSVGAGPDSTGIYENGEAPALPSTDMTSTGINLHSGDIFAVTMSYNGTNLVVTITDTTTNATATQTYAVNIPSYTGSSAYVGFTAGTGALTSTVNILNWTFTPGATQVAAALTASAAKTTVSSSVSAAAKTSTTSTPSKTTTVSTKSKPSTTKSKPVA